MELRDRLRTAFGSPTQNGRRQQGSGASERPRQLPGLRREETPGGPVFFIEERWSLTHHHGDYCLGEALDLSAEARARLLLDAPAGSLRDATFVDIETTGLSGGTGTLVFMIGVGAFESEEFVLRQYFLADVAFERAMLQRVVDVLTSRDTIVSFNGRRFDLPLILTRLTLSRLKSPEIASHVDLLYPSRWLYKNRLPSCSLGTLEASVLGLQREGDVGGHLAPAIYLDYVRTGECSDLRGVFEHNALDILSLVSLLSHLGRVFAGVGAGAEDYLALGHWDDAARRMTSAISMFTSALAEAQTLEQRSTARRRLARLHKRVGKIDRAMSIWREEAGKGPPHGRLEALIEIAKVSEHQLRDFEAAESLTRQALQIRERAAAALATPRRSQLEQSALEHRLNRLTRRVSAVSRR